MIKVIFVDMKDGETITVQEFRETLKNDSMSRVAFHGDIEHQVAHFIGKLREEKKEEDKCRKQSKR